VSTLGNFRKEAKRWLKALRRGDEQARARLGHAYAKAPVNPTLRDIQHALAREHGHESWTTLMAALAASEPATRGSAERVAAFLEYACPPAPVMGPSNRQMAQNAAVRILSRHPEIARDSIYTAVTCGELDAVERLLNERPELAAQKGGPRGWPALMYLCNARLPIASTTENAVAIARILLDRGADPNSYYVAWDQYRYTALAAVFGGGEEEARPHPNAEALARLLFERHAEPYDRQLLYNVFADHRSRAFLNDEIIWLLDLIYTHSVQRGRVADWSDPEWPMLDPWGRGHGAGFLLEAAIDRNLPKLAEWLLAHGASPNATRPQGAGLAQRSPYELALRKELPEMVGLLVRYGGTPLTVAVEGESEEEAFVAACFRLDGDDVRARLADHPEYLQSPKAIFAAAQHDRADVMRFLLDLGMSPDLEDPARGHARPLHEAAGSDSIQVVSLLIERGAEVDPRESNWNGTPLGFAVYGQRRRAMALLGRLSRDVFNLAYIGEVRRLRDVLGENSDLAKIISAHGYTPLMCLPDDERLAVDIVELLLAYGADPAFRDEEGRTAADIASRRGLERAAELLRAKTS
jgi:ankyrin repeat protein